MKKPTSKPAFKPCKGCPTPSMCNAAGRCLMKAKK